MRKNRVMQVGVCVASLLMVAGCRTEQGGSSEALLPSVRIEPASPVRFRGTDSPSPDKPGDCDCNNPSHWDGDQVFVFNSTGHPWRSSGPDMFHMDRDYRKCQYNNQANGGRWIECTWKADDGTLYGWYHLEPNDVCRESHPNSPHLTAPKIGAVKSSDNGANWQDLGVVLESVPSVRCDTTNFYFAGGNGDFSIMLDARKEFLYFLFSTYPPDVAEQGVGIARMRWADRDHPVGTVRKWHRNDWSEPGIRGHVTPIFNVKTDWHRGDVDAFWGPSIHWNTYLKQYVILLNRAIDSRWKQEGVYITYNRRLDNPNSWSQPQKILDSPGGDRWYPQVFGLDASRRETDKLAGQVARLFVRGESRWEIHFQR